MTFASWLQTRYTHEKRNLDPDFLERVIEGLAPFNEEELLIIEARHQYQWRVVKVLEDGDLLLNITNHSNLKLSYLSLGVTSRDFGGRVYVPVSEIAPGASRTVSVAVYKGLVDPYEVTLIALPDPLPIERSIYWEFKTLETM
jgi:hypothetical protein